MLRSDPRVEEFFGGSPILGEPLIAQVHRVEDAKKLMGQVKELQSWIGGKSGNRKGRVLEGDFSPLQPQEDTLKQP